LDFLGSRPFRYKGLDSEGWIFLDLLGFSRPNLDLSMGYQGFRGKKISACGSRRLSGAARQKLAAEAIRRRGLAHGASLTLFLIFCKQLSALIAIPVDGAASAVMAGLVPAIQAVRLRHRFTGQ
jgi:hypothetical protein